MLPRFGKTKPKWVVLAVVVCSGTAFHACKKTGGEKPASGSKEPVAEPGDPQGFYRPNHLGQYRHKEKFPLKSPCRGDFDCGLTQLRAGDCCPDQCNYTAANKAWIKVLRKMHYPTCVKFLRKHGFDKVCGRPPCKPLPGRAVAKCQKGQCAVTYIAPVIR